MHAPSNPPGTFDRAAARGEALSAHAPKGPTGPLTRNGEAVTPDPPTVERLWDVAMDVGQGVTSTSTSRSPRLSRFAIVLVILLVGMTLVALPASAAVSAVTWTQRNPAVSPPQREEASIAADTANATTVLFGGFENASSNFGDTWVWDGTTWEQQHPATSPPARLDAAMATDPVTGNVVLFGGGSPGFETFGDTWVWDGSTWTEQHPGMSPSPRRAAAIATDFASGRIVLFGGEAANGAVLDDTWTWDGSTWTEQHPATSPPARMFATMTGDPLNRDVVLFGGLSQGDYLTDTWTWDGATWIERHPVTNLGIRLGAKLATDSDTGAVVLFGGNNVSMFLAETWTWDGTDWTEQHPLASPPARVEQAMAADPSGGLVLFGGVTDAGLANDTWHLALTAADRADLRTGLVAPARVAPGSAMTEAVTITNAGPAPARRVTIALLLPAHVSITSTTGGPVRFGRLLLWQLAGLAPGRSQTFAVRCLVEAVSHAALVSIALGVSQTPDPTPRNNVALAFTRVD